MGQQTTDKSQLKTADVNSLFPGDARIQPLPLPLGPAYNNSDFKAYINVTFQMYTDQPSSSFAVNQSVLSNIVNQLGQLYYPQGVLFEVGMFPLHPPEHSHDAPAIIVLPHRCCSGVWEVAADFRKRRVAAWPCRHLSALHTINSQFCLRRAGAGRGACQY